MTSNDETLRHEGAVTLPVDLTGSKFDARHDERIENEFQDVRGRYVTTFLASILDRSSVDY